ncbi:MFS transporter [Streptomyces sp. NPDC049099]|uniref:MFS transporter n=1 Tax=Streptomyces sp. NPDC049099 TaxID=3155768 RepID=UPI003418EAC3
MTTTLIPPATAPQAHRDPNVRRWLAAYTSSMLGDNVYYLALSWAAVRAGTPAQAGLVMSASALPRAVLMLGGGVVADRFGPRRVVIGSDAVRCAAVLAVAALLALTRPGLWPLALLALVFGTVDAVFMPAVGALPARLTEKDQLARVQGMRGLAIRFAGVVGAPLGGLGVAVGGAPAAFALAGLLIAVSVPLLLSVQVRDLPAHRAAREAGTVRGDAPEVPGTVGDDVSEVLGVAWGGGSEVPGVGRGDAPAVPGVGRCEAPAVRGIARGDATVVLGVAGGDASAVLGVAGGDASAVRGFADGDAPPVPGIARDDAPAVPGTVRDDVPGAAGTVWSDLRVGLRYIRRHRVLAPLMLAIALGDLGFVGPLNVGLTLLADHRGWGASGMGWVLAGFGVGAGAASLLLTVRGRLPRAGLVTGCACAAGSVAVGALAFAPTLAAAVGTALLVGLLTGLSGAVCGALLQTQSDPACLGRVTAVSSLVSLGLTPLSMPVAATAIGVWGLGPVYVVSAAVCGLGGLVFLVVPALRRAELPG